jgi:hypothetical protein
MPKPVALTAAQAKRSLAHRIAPRIDKVRQIATKLGLRPYRVALVWTAFDGSERGEGTEVEVKRIELLPTPKLQGMDGVMLNPFTIGLVPIGMVRLKLVSATYTFDVLSGFWVPEQHEKHIPQPINFRYEVVEDGRGDSVPKVQKFRLAAKPERQAGSVSWLVLLERIGTDDDAVVRQCGGT